MVVVTSHSTQEMPLSRGCRNLRKVWYLLLDIGLGQTGLLCRFVRHYGRHVSIVRLDDRLAGLAAVFTLCMSGMISIVVVDVDFGSMRIFTCFVLVCFFLLLFRF